MSVRIFELDGVCGGDLGEKAEGLMHLDTLGLRIPAALIIPDAVYGHYASLAGNDRTALPMRVAAAADAFRASLRESRPISFRCGAKGMRGQRKSFPESVLNLGLMPTHPAWEAQAPALSRVLEDHLESFFAFFGEAPPVDFKAWPLPRQIYTLVDRLFRYFLTQDQMTHTIILQEMVWGDRNSQSLTGMCYTRNPLTGETSDYGHFIQRRQGLSLGGIESPLQRDLSEMPSVNATAYDYLKEACRVLEAHHHAVRSLEYTAEGETMYLLQNTAGNYRIKL